MQVLGGVGRRARGCLPERGRGAGSGLSGARACVSGATTASAHAWRGARAACACRYLSQNSLSSVPAGLFDHPTAMSRLWVEQQPRGWGCLGRVCVSVFVHATRTAGRRWCACCVARAHARVSLWVCRRGCVGECKCCLCQRVSKRDRWGGGWHESQPALAVLCTDRCGGDVCTCMVVTGGAHAGAGPNAGVRI